MNKEDIMRRVIDTARRNLEAGGEGLTPVVSVIVKNGEIVGEGYNTVIRDHDPTAHAEVAAIRDACRRLKTCDLSGCEIYVISDPCPMCFAAIYHARLDRLYYGNARADTLRQGIDHKYLFRDAALPTEKRTLPSEQLLGDEARAVMEAWAKLPSFRKLKEIMRPNDLYLSSSKR
ncbi:MAG: hypothetical protein A3J29_00095 [Acidobacteria bacterium RIFCSPLOWO2_12_FULL_67_14b]|nr:MAG: hypothetical protein A3J29_00095 [Acidobacteria bacterium RIFCSPLOWO2_12_FULL_67_14b]